ncbi:COP9/signalosome complex subunit Csn1 [Castilleja foliolosa]|uniref:COP9/signalosome complex subunit Csn1 n=1 Tax=Castilleja foliolosa TaxID=1961234 RepID=A0ABD3CDN5_9LAMI
MTTPSNKENKEKQRDIWLSKRLGFKVGPSVGIDDSKALGTNLIKESIRMGYNDFSEFYYAHGQLGEAFKNFVGTRDYCTTSKHIIQLCLHAILVSIEMGQFTHVTSYVSKAEQSQDALDPVTIAKLRSAAGLAHLEGKKYKLAARKLVSNTQRATKDGSTNREDDDC